MLLLRVLEASAENRADIKRIEIAGSEKSLKNFQT